MPRLDVVASRGPFIPYANGVVSPSPGLPRSGYPGKWYPRNLLRQRRCVPIPQEFRHRFVGDRCDHQIHLQPDGGYDKLLGADTTVRIEPGRNTYLMGVFADGHPIGKLLSSNGSAPTAGPALKLAGR